MQTTTAESPPLNAQEKLALLLDRTNLLLAIEGYYSSFRIATKGDQVQVLLVSGFGTDDQIVHLPVHWTDQDADWCSTESAISYLFGFSSGMACKAFQFSFSCELHPESWIDRLWRIIKRRFGRDHSTKLFRQLIIDYV